MLLSARGDLSAKMPTWLIADRAEGTSRAIESEAESHIAKNNPVFLKGLSGGPVGSKNIIGRGGILKFPRAINPEENTHV